MTSSLENSAPIRTPRNRPAPSPRDQQIYLDYQTTGKRQIDLAAQYKLTQTRISQIIRRVENWLTSTSGVGPDTLDAAGACGAAQPNHSSAASANSAARERLEHRVQYDRLNEAARLALQHFHEPQKIVTHKKGARAGKEFDETTERLLPPSLQCLKIVVQASAQLSRLGGCGSPKANHACETPAELASPITAPNETNLSREQVEAWLVARNHEAAGTGKVPHHFDADLLVHDLVDNLVGESKSGIALHVLARDAGQKVVKCRPYEEKSPPIPPRDGWYYGMYDANGGLVAWLHADQLAGAITPDYPPVSRSSLDASTQTRSASEGSTDAPAASLTTSSSTSPFTTESSQPASPPALTAVSPQTQFHAEYEPQPFDLQSIQPTLYQKGCSP